MELSLKQKKDLATVQFFIPPSLKSIQITNEDIKKFFENSDRWLHKEYAKSFETRNSRDWFTALLWGKKWRGIHIGMYEEGVLDGSIGYYDILFGWEEKTHWIFEIIYIISLNKIDKRYRSVKMEEPVVEFIAKNVFKWIDYEKIMNLYNEFI